MNRSARVLGFLIVAQAALLSSTFNNWGTLGAAVVLIALLVLAIQHSRAERWQQSPKNDAVSHVKPIWIMVGILFMAVLSFAWRASGVLGESSNAVAVAADVIAHFCLLTSLMLWTFRPSRGHILMPFLGLVLVLLCVASGGVSRSLQAQTTVGVLTCLGFVATTRIVFHHRAFPGSAGQMIHLSGSSVLQRERGSRQRGIAVMATVTVLMMVTGAVASLTEVLLPAVQNDLQKRLQSTIEAVDQTRLVGGMRYVRGSSLGSVRQHLTHDPQAVVMVVYSNQQPGYLRGNVFDLYRESRWHSVAEQFASNQLDGFSMADRSISPSGPSHVARRSNRNAKLNHFQLLPVDLGRQAVLEIVGDPMRGNHAFTPLGTRWVEASSSLLTVTCHESIRVGVDTSKPYVIGAESVPTEVVLTPTERMILTEVEPRRKKELESFAKSVFEEAETATEKADAVSSFFRSEFSYGLNPISRPPNADPIMHFLNHRHPAHCEYFATATVLLLRSVGVPTRYVVGYTVDEETQDADRWLGRNRDAHAWAEAYDDTTRRWFPVEATPGRSYKSVFPPSLLALQAQAEADQNSELDSSGGFRGFLSNVWGYLFSLRATDTFFALFQYGQIAVLVGLVGWLVARIKRAKESPLEAAERACRKMLSRVDRTLGRTGLVRTRSESLYQFADRIELESSQDTAKRISTSKRDQIQRAANWLRKFADARYQGIMPENWSG